VRWEPRGLTDAPCLEDLFLARAAVAKDAAALEWLEREVMPALRRTLPRVKASDVIVEDALQVVRAKLLVGPSAKLSVYSGKGPLMSWARALAHGTGLDLLRSSEAGRT